jgi:hypothetical protein
MVRKSFSAAMLIPFVVACAPFAASSAPMLTPDQAALVQTTCDRVMGLSRGGVYRDECRESLSESLVRKMEVQSMAGAYADCDRQNLHEGSAAYSTCILDRQGSNSATAMPVSSLSYDTSLPDNAKSYFDVTNAVHWRREQYSCAQLGLAPGSGAFGQCVASLNAVLMPNPF